MNGGSVNPPARSTPIVGLPRGLEFSIEAIAVVASVPSGTRHA
jgi:hypothetical protein